MIGHYGYWGGMGWFGGLLMLVVWIAVILLAVWVVRAFFPTRRRDARETGHGHELLAFFSAQAA